MTSSFRLETRTRVPAEELFDASLSIDAHIASMSRSRERAVSGVTSGRIELGESVTWRARHFGVWFTLTSRITDLARPRRFVDEQVRGPFRAFHHEHVFTRDGDDTIMVDTLTIASPVGGRLAERVILVPYLRRLIRHRNAHLLMSLGGEVGTVPDRHVWPSGTPERFRRSEVTGWIGRGDAAWQRASADVLTWAVKTRSGFSVADARKVEPDARLTVTARIAGLTIHEPVQVVDVVEDDDRVGFSYRTLPGHPVSGEEAFIVHREGEDIFLTVRSLTAPSEVQPWRVLHPVLRIAQLVARRRYLRALR